MSVVHFAGRTLMFSTAQYFYHLTLAAADAAIYALFSDQLIISLGIHLNYYSTFQHDVEE